MNKPRFLELVKDPDKLEFFDLEKLEEVVANFPYFQAAHVFIAKLAKEQSSMFAAEKLNLAAVCTLDRKNLKRIIQSKPRKLTVFINRDEQPQTTPVPTLLINEEMSSASLLMPEHEPSPEEEKAVYVNPVQEVEPIQHTEEEAETLSTHKNKVDEIISIEPTQETDTLKENDFYTELEKNLTQLHKAKREAGFPTSPVSNPSADSIEESKVSTASIVEENEKIEKEKEEIEPKIENESKEEIEENALTNLLLRAKDIENKLPPPTIENSRLDDILLHKIQDENKSSENDLLIKYFDFLDQKRKDKTSQKSSVTHIIDNFISNEPTIPKLKVELLKEPLVDLSVKSVQPKIKIISENFAKILVLQGKVENAIEMYEALSLKYPEKKAYFANLILELKK